MKKFFMLFPGLLVLLVILITGCPTPTDEANNDNTNGAGPDTTALSVSVSTAKNLLNNTAVSANGADIPNGALWVPPAVNELFAGAISTADAFLDGTYTQAQVNAAKIILDEAIEVFKDARNNGSADAIDKEDLIEKISDANAAKADVIVADGPGDAAPGEKYVSQSVMDTFEDAINTAEAVLNTAKTTLEVSEATEALDAAIAVFTAAIQTDGSKTGFTAGELDAKITEAKALKDATTVSANGNDVSPLAFWVNQTDMASFENAITAAEAAESETRDQLYLDLVSGINSFTAARKAGTTPDKSGLAGVINNADTAKEGITIAANAGEVPSGKIWATSGQLAALETVYNTAYEILNNNAATKNAVDDAKTDLDNAIETFYNAVSANGPGTKTEYTAQELEAKIAEAKALRDATTVSTNGNDVSHLAFWVIQADMTSFESIITAAEAATGGNRDELYMDLLDGMDSFTEARKVGTIPDKNGLIGAINDADTVKTDIEIADDAGEVPNGKSWATSGQMAALETAYDAAIVIRDDKAATKNVVDNAETALLSAIGAINANGPGTKTEFDADAATFDSIINLIMTLNTSGEYIVNLTEDLIDYAGFRATRSGIKVTIKGNAPNRKISYKETENRNIININPGTKITLENIALIMQENYIGDRSLIYISGGTLEIKAGAKLDGANGPNSVLSLNDGGTIIMSGGEICNGPAGINIRNTGTVTMTGGTIRDNGTGISMQTDSQNNVVIIDKGNITNNRNSGLNISGTGHTITINEGTFVSNQNHGVGISGSGHTITINGGDISDNQNNALGITGSGHIITINEGTISDNNFGIGWGSDSESCSLTINGGDIINNLQDGMYITGSGHIIAINDVNISNNLRNGMQIYGSDHTITIDGDAAIKNNQQYGVSINGSSHIITMEGGSIANNGTPSDDVENYVGVNLRGTNNEFTMNDGIITGNTGDGVRMPGSDCTFTMNGGTISKNGRRDIEPMEPRNGVELAGANNQFIFNGGSISENTSCGVRSQGTNCTFTMSEPAGSTTEIRDNSGDGVRVESGTNCEFEFIGGTISGNLRYGVSFQGTNSDCAFTMKGGSIGGNGSTTGSSGLSVASGAGANWEFEKTGGIIYGSSASYENLNTGGSIRILSLINLQRDSDEEDVVSLKINEDQSDFEYIDPPGWGND